MTSGARYHFEVRVPFADTDRAGIVWWGNFLRYLEAAEDALYRDFGRPRGAFTGPGQVELPRTALRCSFRSPARYDDLLDVVLGIEAMSSRRVQWVFEIHQKSNGKLVVEGTFETAFMVSDTLKGCEIPSDIREALTNGFAALDRR